MQNLMKDLTKKLAQTLLGEYSAYYIYSWSNGEASPGWLGMPAALRVATVDEMVIQSSVDPLIREQAGYAGPGSHAYACFIDDRIVGVCFYWFGERYRSRNFWPLADGEAKLVQIISLPEMRSRGIATRLIAASSQDIIQKGFSRSYARIWHSHTASLRAFERAGWKRVALVVEINPLRQSRPIRISLGLRSFGRRV